MGAQTGLEYLSQVGLRVNETNYCRSERVIHPRSPCLLARSSQRLPVGHGAVGIEVGRRLRGRAVIQVKVPGAKVQGAPTVRRAHAVRTVVCKSPCRVGKAIQTTESESRIVRTLVLDRVVDRERVVVQVIVVEGVREMSSA